MTGAIESPDAAYHARMCVLVSSPTNSHSLVLTCLTLHGRKTLQFTIADRFLGQHTDIPHIGIENLDSDQ
jgi:hypothetical protein